ncbi:MAG: DUF1552 domain-containing protein [Gemmataceae bacterium]
MLANAMNRRAFLRGVGVSLGLPLLDAMRPARAAAAEAPPRRFVAIQTTQGIMPHLFFPEKAGRDYALSPYLKLLEPLRQDFTVFSGVSHPGVDGGHQNERCFLSAAPHPTAAAFRNSISIDQVIAEKVGHQTRYPFLVLHVANGGETSMSYTRSGVAIPGEKSCAGLYARLFVQGTATEIAARVNDLRSGRSLLDSVRARARRLERNVGAADRDRLEQYFSSIRELENQLKQAEAWEHRPKPAVKMAPPEDIKDSALLLQRFRTMLDLVKLAVETDSTRVVTLFLEPLGILSGVAGVQNETHSLTHHGNRPEMVEELSKIESAQLRVFHDFIKGLKETKESGSTLLDQTSVIYGTCMGNANGHTNRNWPVLLAGGGFKHGQHLAFNREQNVPLANLFVSILQRQGLEMDRFASSTGTLRGLEWTA